MFQNATRNYDRTGISPGIFFEDKIHKLTDIWSMFPSPVYIFFNFSPLYFPLYFLQYVAALYLRKVHYLITTISPCNMFQEKMENPIIRKKGRKVLLQIINDSQTVTLLIRSLKISKRFSKRINLVILLAFFLTIYLSLSMQPGGKPDWILWPRRHRFEEKSNCSHTAMKTWVCKTLISLHFPII